MCLSAKNQKIKQEQYCNKFSKDLQIKSIAFLYTVIVVVACVKFSIGAITNYHKRRGLK